MTLDLVPVAGVDRECPTDEIERGGFASWLIAFLLEWN